MHAQGSKKTRVFAIQILYTRGSLKIHWFLHEFDRDSSKKHVFTVNLCFEAFQVIFFHDLLDVYGCFMTVKRLLFTRGCGDGSYENYVFI